MSKLERQGDENRVELEQMSTAELEELLRRDFHAPEGPSMAMLLYFIETPLPYI